MRARRGILIGWIVVGCYAAALVAAAVTTEDSAVRPGDRDDAGAAEELVDAWERSRTATFVRTGTFERRSEVTGSVISSEDLLAQRPPQRLHRQLGGIEGRNDRRIISCPSAAGGRPSSCSFGQPTGRTYDEDVERGVTALQALLTGDDPVYAVARGDEPGCFDLVQLRVEPRAPFGREARFCFDEATGAPTNSRVAYAGGIVEVVAVTDLRGTVADADLEP